MQKPADGSARSGVEASFQGTHCLASWLLSEDYPSGGDAYTSNGHIKNQLGVIHITPYCHDRSLKAESPFVRTGFQPLWRHPVRALGDELFQYPASTSAQAIFHPYGSSLFEPNKRP